jgi:amino acid adenylation domain-containing protein
MLAALVAVTHRRTGHDRIQVSWPTGSATITLTPRTVFGELVEALPVVDEATVDGVELVTHPYPALRSDIVAQPDLAILADLMGQAVLAPAAHPVSTIPFHEPDHDPAGGIAPAPARCLHHLVGEWAAATPDAVAVAVTAAAAAADESLTYRALAERAGQLAQRLREQGVRTEEVVGVLADRSPRLIAGLLGILTAGAAYLALDPEMPPARLATLIRQAGVRVVLADHGLADRIDGSGADVLPLEASGGAQAAEWTGRPANLAYVSYTSGSTGTPKAVGVPHAAVGRLVCRPDWATFGPADVFLQAAPIAFDASTLEIWAPLCNGGRLVLLPPGRLDLDQLGELVRVERVTVLWLTAGLFQQFVATRLADLAGVRHLIAGGDVVDPAAVARLLAAHPGISFTNGYGPTENTTFTTCAAIGSVSPPAPLPIGVAISGTRVLVLDPDLRPVPTGIAGELYAGGAGLARGYLGSPGATADRFVPDPTGRHPGARVYRTGDLVRGRPDGQLDYLGRLDHQTKVNGYRVEPGEIETVLNQNPGIAACAVATFRAGNTKKLAGYLVAANARADAVELVHQARVWLRDRLPEHLVPSHFVVIDQVPLTAAGKVDRAALPPVELAPRLLPNPYVPPAHAVERYLCELWADLLGTAEVGVEDDFFELGGHSLTAAEFLAQLERDRGVEVSARAFYLRPTVLELAELVTSAGAPRVVGASTDW